MMYGCYNMLVKMYKLLSMGNGSVKYTQYLVKMIGFMATSFLVGKQILHCLYNKVICI